MAPGRVLPAVNLAVKLLLVGLLLLAVLRPDLPQFEGKAMTGRALTYPLAALLVPAAWLLRGRRGAYPHAVDVLLVLPFLIDTLGNALDLYDTVGWWDDANHLVNWGLLTGAVGLALVRLPLGPATVAGLAVGFGAVTAILWELAEYLTFIRDSPELDTAYEDTLGDLTLGLTGSVVAASLTALAVHRRTGLARGAPGRTADGAEGVCEDRRARATRGGGHAGPGGGGGVRLSGDGRGSRDERHRDGR